MDRTRRTEQDIEATVAGPGPDLEAEKALLEACRRLLGDDVSADISLDRYVLLDRLGSGGAGVVYSAYDPALQREVAIKLIGRGVAGRKSGEPRLLREARALAALSHPNVVRIYDVGTYDHASLGRVSSRGIDPSADLPARRGVFLVMELVKGRTLAQWLEGERTQIEVLRVLVAAGRGLAAAHTAGLVHRDFKPGNVLVGDDDRILVADFGLALLADSDERPSVESAGEEAHASTRLTATGAVLGTPSYMAVEQHDGGLVDARTDQFSFCVTLFEALYGRRPFQGASLQELEANKRSGVLEDLQPPRAVPRTIHEAILRGLEADPDRRFPDMEALLGILGPVRRSGLHRLLLVGLLPAAAVTAAIAWALPDPPCDTAPERMSKTWSASTQQQVRAGFESSGSVLPASTWPQVYAEVGAYASRWTAMRVAVCRRQSGGEDVGLSLACLERRAHELAVFVDLLLEADAPTLARAVAATRQLASLDACEDPQRLEYGEPTSPPGAVRVQVEAVDAQVRHAWLLWELARYGDGQAVAAAAVERAAAIGHAPTLAEALRVRAKLELALGRADEAERTLHETIAAAKGGNAHQLEAEAWVDLAFLLSERWPPRGVEALRALRMAEAMVGSVPNRRRLEIRLFLQRGKTRAAEGDLTGGIADVERALPLVREGDRPGETATVLLALGTVLTRRAEQTVDAAGAPHDDAAAGQRAIDVLGRALGLVQQHYGASHPLLVAVLNNLGHAHRAVGDRAAAEREFQEALAISEVALGSHHPHTRANRTELAVELLERGELATALHLLELTLDGDEPRSAQRARTLECLGRVHHARGDLVAALALLEQAVAIGEYVYGGMHPDRESALEALAAVRTALAGSEEVPAEPRHVATQP